MAAARMIVTEGEEVEEVEMVAAEVTVVEVEAVGTKTVPRRMTAVDMAEKIRGKTVAAATESGKVPPAGTILVLQNRRK